MILLEDADGGAVLSEAAEEGGGLDEVDVRVQVLREAVARRADERVAISVLPDVVFLSAAASAAARERDQRGALQQSTDSQCRAFSRPG